MRNFEGELRLAITVFVAMVFLTTLVYQVLPRIKLSPLEQLTVEVQ